ncbi:MAG: DUF4249 domain-containing protein [Prevotellaceae bacterium]|jgi:hypothetical protein|nr:DUF4249 domain-containing protein [Prevotellaceae bacterium]
MRKKPLILLFAVSLLASCVEPFDIRTDDSPPAIVIYGYLTDEPAYHTVRISRSSPYFDTAANVGISDAEVKITSSNGEVIDFVEVAAVPGTYRTTDRTAGTPGATYLLSVEVDFDNDGVREKYTASSMMQSAVKVDSIEVKHMKIMGNKFYVLYLYAQDTPAEDYYLGHYRINDTVVLSNISRLSPMSDAAFNGQYINGLMIRRFWDASERENVDENDEQEYRRVYTSPGDTITFSLSRIEKGYHDFISQCQQEMTGENPFFGGPASNIVTNISGGALGYFTTYAFSTAKAVVPEEN